MPALLEKYELAIGVAPPTAKSSCEHFLLRVTQQSQQLQRLQQQQQQVAVLGSGAQSGYTPSPAVQGMWKITNAGDVEIPMHPEVLALAQHCGLNEIMTKRLNTAMMLRYDSFEADMGALLDAIKTARNPAGLLTAKIKEMQWGTFVGKSRPDEDTEALCRKFKLDEQAANKLTYWLNSRGASRQEDLKMIAKHLEYSNKPSAKIMQLLSRLWSGQQIGFPERGPAPGSWADLRLSLKDIRQQQTQKAAFASLGADGTEGEHSDDRGESCPAR